MKTIQNFMLPENTNQLYKNEAISSISLTRDVADKINELVDAYNELSKIDLEWKQEQDGRNRKAILYMKDNLVNSLNELTEQLIASGFVDSRITANLSTIVSRVDNLISGITTDSEVIDGRVGVRTERYITIGGAIRGQIEEVIAMYYNILDLLADKKTNNFIHIVNMLPESLQNSFTVTFLADTQSLVFNGVTNENNSFILYTDGKTISSNKGVAYLIWDKNITGGTWGAKVTYSDGTVSEVYTDVNRFIPVDTGKLIRSIRIVLSSGFTFQNAIFKLYGAYYENGRFTPYDDFYSLKTPQELFGVNLKGKKWVSLGDSFTENTGNTGDDWQKVVADYFGMVYVACGKGGSTTGGFSASDVYSKIPVDADIITVMGGANDHSQSLPLDNEDRQYYYNSGHYAGAIRLLIKKLQSDFPNAKIVFCNCLGVRLNTSGVNQDLPYFNGIDKTLTDYANKCLEVCQQMGIPCINLCGESGINTLNGANYLSDNLHPNSKGYEVISKVYIHNFKQMFDYGL